MRGGCTPPAGPVPAPLQLVRALLILPLHEADMVMKDLTPPFTFCLPPADCVAVHSKRHTLTAQYMLYSSKGYLQTSTRALLQNTRKIILLLQLGGCGGEPATSRTGPAAA